MSAHQFRARIYKVGINRCVDVPEQVSLRLGKDLHVLVKGWIEGVPMRSTLVPRSGGGYRLFVHSRIWRRLGVDAGDTVRVSLLRDRESREPAVPADLAAALSRDDDAQAAFSGLTVALRREIVNWILRARTKQTRDRRIQVGLERLLDRWKRKQRRHG